MIKNLLFAGIGGFIGTVLRYLPYQFIKINQNFWITLFINIIGSFLIGLIIGYGLKNQVWDAKWRSFFAVGVCGGFTTFSSFSLENIQLLQNGKIAESIMYIGISIIAGLLAAYLGLKLSL